jgi:hypothetical protein
LKDPVPIVLHIASRRVWLAAAFAVFGATTGAVAAACTFHQIGEVHGVTIGGYCFGVQPTSTSACGGIDGAVYVFPGLVFGIVFGPLLYFFRCFGAIGAVVYALAAFAANLVAVSICISLNHPIDDLLEFDNPLLATAFSGVVAGAVGSTLLGAALAAFNGGVKRLPSIAVGASLGVLTPLTIMFDYLGVFAFFIIWQCGYAAAVAASLSRPD